MVSSHVPSRESLKTISLEMSTGAKVGDEETCRQLPSRAFELSPLEKIPKCPSE
jgi:hypothetical protein